MIILAFLALAPAAHQAIPDRYETGYCREQQKQIDMDGIPSRLIIPPSRSWIFHFSTNALKTAWGGREPFERVIHVGDGGVVLPFGREVEFRTGEIWPDGKVNYDQPFSARLTEVFSSGKITIKMRCQGVLRQ